MIRVTFPHRLWRRSERKLLAHVEIMRPYTVSYAGLLAVAGASVACRRRLPVFRALTAAMVTMCGWLAGHYVGDYFDRDLDALSKPARPLPSGRVSPREALAGMLLLIGCGNAAALRLGRPNLMLAVVTTLLGLAYSKVFKSRALLGNLDRGLLGACAVAFGALSAARRVSAPVVLLGCASLFHDGATNLVGALRDVEGDRAAGCRTVPVVYGLERSVELAVGLASLGWVFAVVTLALVRPARAALVLFGAASVVGLGVYARLLALRGNLRRAQALAAHKLLVVERLLLAAAFIAARAPGLAVLLLIASLPASVVLQASMRDRHESQTAEPRARVADLA